MRFCPQGGSMVPFLRQGDIVSICPEESCRIGDIVFCEVADNLLLHRVVAKKGKWIITKGDSLGHCDVPVRRRQILGRAVLRKRGGDIHRLDLLGARFWGLSFSLTVALLPGLIPLLIRVKALLGHGLDRRGEFSQIAAKLAK